MYDIEQLENEWKRYRKKKLKPWYIGILLFLVVAVPSVFFLMSDRIDFDTLKNSFQLSNKISSSEVQPSGAKEDKENSTVLVNGALDRLETKKKESRITAVVQPVKKPVNILVDVPVLDDTSSISYSNDLPVADKPKVHLDIVESSSVTAYEDVERRFSQSHEIDDALFLARSYYKKGDYKKSEYWALETNKLDEESEESLFIFVKSKVKLGRRNEAITILTDYIKMTDSQEGKKLLYEIENNKI